MGTVKTRLATIGAVAALALLVVGCAGAATPTPTVEPTATPAPPTATPAPPTATPAPPTATPAPTDEHGGMEIAFEAASTTITVDGDASDWSGIEGATVRLEQIRLDELPPEVANEIEFGPLDPIDATLKVASDGQRIYVLFEIPDDYDYDAADHNRSASVAVMFRIDDPAAPHMGAEEPDLDRSLGLVDIWHWELDCGPGVVSGGQGVTGGDDPACNLDDEYSATPEDREDDGGGDIENTAAENGLLGVWEHSARAAGAGAQGAWIFEISRPLQTGDPQDGQLASGSVAHMALAYFDPDEGSDGWSDAGHLQSAYNGWIEVTLR